MCKRNPRCTNDKKKYGRRKLAEITTIEELIVFEKELNELTEHFKRRHATTKVEKQDIFIEDMIKDAERRIKETISELREKRND